METVEAQEAPESGLERMGLVPSVALGGGRGRNVCPCEPTPPPERSPRTPELSIALPQLPQCRAKARGTKGSIWVINQLIVQNFRRTGPQAQQASVSKLLPGVVS